MPLNYEISLNNHISSTVLARHEDICDVSFCMILSSEEQELLQQDKVSLSMGMSEVVALSHLQGETANCQAQHTKLKHIQIIILYYNVWFSPICTVDPLCA